jgi:Ca-activated chloride channel homolog
MNQLYLKYRLVCLVLCLFSFRANSQVIPDKTSFDFGDIFSTTERFVDFYFKNNSDKKAYFLRADKHPDLQYITSSSTILPDSSIAVRIHVNPKKKGNFSYTIPIFLSDRNEALTVKITGNLKEFNFIETSGLQECPDFNKRPMEGNPLDFKLTVITIDKESKKTLSKTNVDLIQNGLIRNQLITDRNGQATEKVSLGYSYFYATHPGYNSAEMGVYINFKRNRVVIELEKETLQFSEFIDEEELQSVAVIQVDSVVEPNITQLEIDTVEFTYQIEKDTVQHVEVESAAFFSSFEDIPFDNFDKTLFKRNNLVFVLDVSTSMRDNERFELLKYALYQLMDYIRPEDHIALVTYGSDARVLLTTTSGVDKAILTEKVEELKPTGYTAGGKGIKLGYDLAKKGYIENGNNQVIVITDGAFNRDSDDYERTVNRFTNQGYVLSVVGIKNSKPDEVKMREVAELGNGRYVPIFKLADAKNNLISEIRRASYIN